MSGSFRSRGRSTRISPAACSQWRSGRGNSMRGSATRAIQVHRWTGRGYVVSVLVGGVGALALAPRSMHGLVTHVGFGMLAVLWLSSTIIAYRRIRARDIASHRRWMTRSYALTLAAVTLRIWLPLSQIAGSPSRMRIRSVAWLCWVPNLVVAEWIILAPRPRRTASRLRSAMMRYPHPFHRAGSSLCSSRRPFARRSRRPRRPRHRPPKRRGRVFHDSLFQRLAGDWTMTGAVKGKPVTYRLHAEWVLQHTFFRLEHAGCRRSAAVPGDRVHRLR